jgi:hypothetical protein
MSEPYVSNKTYSGLLIFSIQGCRWISTQRWESVREQIPAHNPNKETKKKTALITILAQAD